MEFVSFKQVCDICDAGPYPPGPRKIPRAGYSGGRRLLDLRPESRHDNGVFRMAAIIQNLYPSFEFRRSFSLSGKTALTRARQP